MTHSVSGKPMKSPQARKRTPLRIGSNTLQGRERGHRARSQRNASRIGSNTFLGRTPGWQ